MTVVVSAPQASTTSSAKIPFRPLGEVLARSTDWITLNPTEIYAEVTVRLWGKGVVARGNKLGGEIGGARRLRVHPREFILSRIDARNGAFGLVPAELEGAVVSNDFPCFRADESALVPEYLGWLSWTRWFSEACKQVSEGTTNRVRLNEEKFLAIRIPLPPVDEQQRIVAKIAHLAAMIDEVYGLRRRIRSGAEALVASLHFDASAGRKCRMSELVELSENRELVRSDGDYPQVGIRGFGGGLFAKAPIKGTDTTYRHFNKLHTGQLVLSQVKGWEGAIGVCPPTLSGFFASPEYRTFNCLHKQCEPEYLDVIVRSQWFTRLLADATRGQGARRERTRPELFLQIKIAFPPLDDQRRLLRSIRKLQRIPTAHQETADKLDALLPSILDKAFKGEL